MSRVIVTGGAGFIGSALVRHLVLDRGEDVLVIDKLTYAGNLASLASVESRPNYRLLNRDICDARAMHEAFRSFDPEIVYHLAAESHVDRSIESGSDFVRTNVLGTFTLLEAARRWLDDIPESDGRRFRFIHVSTDEVFGSLGPEGSFSESSAYDPSSPYSASKAGSDHLARAWARTYGLPVIVSNCSNNYGPYQHPEKLIPVTILNAIHGRPLPVYGAGLNVRDWLHVDDHVAALEAIARGGRVGETYVVGGRNELRNLTMVRTICAVLDRLRPAGAPHDRLIEHVTDRPGHDQRYAIDPTRIEAELGWTAKQSFETGIERTVAWYLENSAWWSPLLQAPDPGTVSGRQYSAVS